MLIMLALSSHRASQTSRGPEGRSYVEAGSAAVLCDSLRLLDALVSLSMFIEKDTQDSQSDAASFSEL